MSFAKWAFRLAGIWGLAVLPPLYFLEAHVGAEMPPAITHPEYFYGFVGVAIAWQVAFLVISSDPLRFRPLMVPSILEKVLYGGAVLVLLAQGRAPAPVAATAVVDLLWGAAFAAAWLRTGPAGPAR